jgi:hypothetical protein
MTNGSSSPTSVNPHWAKGLSEPDEHCERHGLTLTVPENCFGPTAMNTPWHPLSIVFDLSRLTRSPRLSRWPNFPRWVLLPFFAARISCLTLGGRGGLLATLAPTS